MTFHFSSTTVGDNDRGSKTFSVTGPGNRDAKILGVFLQPAGEGYFPDTFSTRVSRIVFNTLAGLWEAICIVRREDEAGRGWGMELKVDALWVIG